ncbi:integrase/recombinase xerD homolog [Pecten maximus]|uniref:integrase/recombinase xerD homolog n=1 Tax=Pecten maximus TaxID=6579 RepID=UPI0014586D6E|nr:integrase/recombinase xerD homolog [Pecten maximus]
MADRLLNSKSDNTNKKYFDTFRRWEHFCSTHSCCALPANPVHLALYLNYLLDKRSSFSVISATVYAIKWVHDINGHSDPTTNSFVRNLMESSKRTSRKPVCKKDPITTDTLIHLCNMFSDSRDLLVIRDLSMILLCFSGFLRFNELSNLLCSDLKIFDSHFILVIRKSKTDQYRHGSEVVISKGQTSACPHAMILKYIEIAGIDLQSDIFLFKPIFRSCSTCKLIQKNKRLSYTGARQAISKRLSLVCDVRNVGLHSLRAGGATVAANNGVNDRCFKRHGRWKSETAKDGYVADSLQARLKVTQKLGL